MVTTTNVGFVILALILCAFHQLWQELHENRIGRVFAQGGYLIWAVCSLVLLLSCAPAPPRTVALGDEPAIDSIPVAAEPWASPRPIHILMFNMAPGIYHAYAGASTTPFLWGYLPAPPAREPLHPVLRELNAERIHAARVTGIGVRQLYQGSQYHVLELHAMTGVRVSTPVTVTVRRTR